MPAFGSPRRVRFGRRQRRPGVEPAHGEGIDIVHGLAFAYAAIVAIERDWLQSIETVVRVRVNDDAYRYSLFLHLRREAFARARLRHLVGSAEQHEHRRGRKRLADMPVVAIRIEGNVGGKLKRFAHACSRSSETPPVPCIRTTAGTLPSRSNAESAGSDSVAEMTIAGCCRYVRVMSGRCEAGV